ncbi:MAG: hypothetical protein L0027_18235 [Candidatus Rokubacteria bacterium]|nr:hypothetical protein [Candidatus Rokubacteria bacterium]
MTTALRPEAGQAREHLKQRGTAIPAAQIRERVAAALTAIEDALDRVWPTEARARPFVRDP